MKGMLVDRLMALKLSMILAANRIGGSVLCSLLPVMEQDRPDVRPGWPGGARAGRTNIPAS
jgi:hypothetical protein